MTSSNVYKQSVYDHRAILVAVSVVDDGSLNVKKYYQLLSNICEQFEIVKINTLSNNGDEAAVRRIYFNFKKDYSVSEKEWENFQIHHRAVGLMFIGEFKSGLELDNILKAYAKEKDKGNGIVIESRLVLIYDENNEELVRSIRQNLKWSDEMCSSDSISTSNEKVSEDLVIECEKEVSYIKESLLLSDIIWYHKSLILGGLTNSSCSMTDSISSDGSMAWKISSQNSESSITSAAQSAPALKSSNPLDSVNDVRPTEYLEIYSFLQSVYEKLLSSLSSRESALTNKTEPTVSKTISNGMETSSDSGSMLSLDDNDFNLSDPLEVDRKKFQEEHRYNKTSKSRHYSGRLAKQCGDYALLCGQYWQSYHYYQLAICYLKKYNNDQLWLAGAEEGLCCAWISYNFDSNQNSFNTDLVESLHNKSRQAFVNQLKAGLNDVTAPPPSTNADQIDFSFFKKFAFNDLFKNPPEILNLDDLNDKYLSSISRYKKSLKTKTPSLHPIHIDSCIKASRFFIDQHRYLQASNFLKLIKSDLSVIDQNLDKYHNALSKFYSEMGFTRKSIVHKYQMITIIDQSLDPSGKSNSKLTINSSANKRQKLLESKLSIVIEILSLLRVDTTALLSTDKVNEQSLNIVENVPNSGFESLKLKLMLELFQVCRFLNYGAWILVAIGLSIIDNWYHLLTPADCQRLIDDLGALCRVGQHERLCLTQNLPRLVRVSPTRLPDHLLPRRFHGNAFDADDSESVFIFTPLTRPREAGPVVWVSGEEAEIVMLFDNLLPVPMQLCGLQVHLECGERSLWLPAEGASLHSLPGNSRRIHCHFIVVPMEIGLFRIVGLSYRLAGVPAVVFLPRWTLDTVHGNVIVSVEPPMPQLRLLLSSLTTEPITQDGGPLPPNTVLSGTISIFEGEWLEFSVLVSNESASLDVADLEVSLDELERGAMSRGLLSRVGVEDEHNGRLGCVPLYRGRMLTLMARDGRLPLRALSSLRDDIGAQGSPGSPVSLPTEAALRLRLDATDRRLCRELIAKETVARARKNGHCGWRGQIRVSVRYQADGAEVGRESVAALDLRLNLGLSLVGLKVDPGKGPQGGLAVVLTLVNFTDNKINLDVYWGEARLGMSSVVIVPDCGRISRSNSGNRICSQECRSNIVQYRLEANVIDLKALFVAGTLRTKKDLTGLVLSQLRMSWIMQDSSLDRKRQGNVNLTMCLCQYERNNTDMPISHDTSFSVNDILRIIFWKNVTLDNHVFVDNSEIDSPTPPSSSVESSITINTFESVHYRMQCTFGKENCCDMISEDVLCRVSLRCCVTPIRVVRLNSQSSCDNVTTQCYLLGGNSALILDKHNTENVQLSGLVLFLAPGSYTIHCQMVISADQSYGCHRPEEVLYQSGKYEIHVV